jgi:hypothetical protein
LLTAIYWWTLYSQIETADSKYKRVYFTQTCTGHGGLLSPNWNTFKNRNKEYDETLYPLDHAHAGQIRDFSLFNHFVKPMPAGVTVTCVMDCCHSGSVLDLPFTYQPTSAGTIRMRQSMDSLSNLAFLHILAGGILPHGFGHVAHHIESVTGGNIDDFQGTGLDEMLNDSEATDFNPNEYGDVGDGLDMENADIAPGLDGGADVDPGFDGAGVGADIAGPDMVPDMGAPDSYNVDPGDCVDSTAFDQSNFVSGEDVDPSSFGRGMFGDNDGGGFSMTDAASGFDGSGADADDIDCG